MSTHNRIEMTACLRHSSAQRLATSHRSRLNTLMAFTERVCLASIFRNSASAVTKPQCFKGGALQVRTKASGSTSN